jgi:hypothetical protein
MYLNESGIKVNAVADSTSGVLQFDISNIQNNIFYIIIAPFDTMYNQSMFTIESNSVLTVSNPVHRWYEKQGEYAGFDGNHVLSMSQSAVAYGIIEDYTHAYENVRSVERRDGQSKPSTAAYFKFDKNKMDNKILSVAVGSSFVSGNKAAKNMLTELLDEKTSNFRTVQSNTYRPQSIDLISNIHDSNYLKFIIDNNNNLNLYNMDTIRYRVMTQWNIRLEVIDIGEADNTEVIMENEKDANLQVCLQYLINTRTI